MVRQQGTRRFTSAYESWRYFGTLPHLANTKRILAVMCDMRIP